MTLDQEEKAAVNTAINACHNLNVAMNELFRLGFSVKLMDDPFYQGRLSTPFPSSHKMLSIHKIVKQADYK